MGKRIPFRFKCRAKKNPEKAIPLTKFAVKHFVHRTTVYSWLRKGKVKGYKHAGQWYIYDQTISFPDKKDRS